MIAYWEMKCNQCAKSFIIYANNSCHANVTFDCCCHKDMAANVNSKHRWKWTKFRFSFITHKRNFETPNETLLENSFHQTKYLPEISRDVSHNQAKYQTCQDNSASKFPRNFEELSFPSKYCWFSPIFIEICWNLLLLLLHSTVTITTYFSLPSPVTTILLLSGDQAMSLMAPLRGWYSYFNICSACVVSQILSFPETSETSMEFFMN